MKTVTTLHGEIGYSKNVEIIARALREQFGVWDNSYVETAVASHIWCEVCGSGCGCSGDERKWTSEHVLRAVRLIRARLVEFEAAASAL